MQSKKGLLFALLGGALWGTAGLFVRWLSDKGFSSMQMVAVRLSICAVVFVLAALVFDRSAFKIKIKDIWCFLCTGIVSVLIFTLCYYKTMETTSLSVAAILLYTAPVFVMFLSALLFKEKITLKKIIACGITLVGCMLISGIIGINSIPLRGLFTGLGSGLCYALYTIFSRFALNKGYSSLTISMYTFIIGGVSALFVTDIKGGISLMLNVPYSPLMFVAFAVINCFLPYVFYTASLKTVESSKASIFASVEPVMAIILSLVVFKEKIDIFGFLGIILVLLSVIFLNLPEKNQSKK